MTGLRAPGMFCLFVPSKLVFMMETLDIRITLVKISRLD
jgi:hypothetical protein